MKSKNVTIGIKRVKEMLGEAGAVMHRLYNIKIGSSTTGKYVIAVLDADNKVLEADEGNNSIVYGSIP